VPNTGIVRSHHPDIYTDAGMVLSERLVIVTSLSPRFLKQAVEQPGGRRPEMVQ
jgi:hypothetical protein